MYSIRSHKLAQDYLRYGIPFQCSRYGLRGEPMFVMSRVAADEDYDSLTSRVSRAQAVRSAYYMKSGSRRFTPHAPVYVIMRGDKVVLAVMADGWVRTDGSLSGKTHDKYVDAGLALAHETQAKMADPEWQQW